MNTSPQTHFREMLRHGVMQAKSPDNAFAYAHSLFWAPYALVGEGGG